MKRVAVGLALLWSAIAQSAPVQDIYFGLGSANDLNLVTFNDAELRDADVQGKVVVGGDAVVFHYNVGTLLGADVTALQVGGNLTAAGDQLVSGDAIVDGTYTNNSASPHHNPVAGNVCSSDVCGGLDLASLFQELSDFSANLAGLTPNVSTTLEYGKLIMTPTGNEAYDFYLATLTQDQFANGRDFAGGSADSFNSDDYLVINVAGSDIDLHSFGFPGWPGILPDSANILFNFYEAETLSMDGGAFYGHILAPNADLTFSEGLITGSVIVDSFYSDAGAQLNTSGNLGLSFTLPGDEPNSPDDTVDANAPMTLTLVLLGVAASFVRRQRAKTTVLAQA